MNIANTAKKLETKERLFVPVIVSIKPVQAVKEIDLTFVRFAQRKHAATTYIESVAHRKQVEANLKESRKVRIGNVIAGLLFTVAFSLCFFMIAIIGMAF